MRRIAELLNEMLAAGVVRGCALFGAVAQMRYTEAVATFDADFEGTPLRVVRADYLACIALSVGRAKAYARVLALRESGAAADDAISELADRHGLGAEWRSFRERFDAR